MSPCPIENNVDVERCPICQASRYRIMALEQDHVQSLWQVFCNKCYFAAPLVTKAEMVTVWNKIAVTVFRGNRCEGRLYVSLDGDRN